eukprot:1521096-Lingulodinium_polyedra.AAC.1
MRREAPQGWFPLHARRWAVVWAAFAQFLGCRDGRNRRSVGRARLSSALFFGLPLVARSGLRAQCALPCHAQ